MEEEAQKSPHQSPNSEPVPSVTEARAWLVRAGTFPHTRDRALRHGGTGDRSSRRWSWGSPRAVAELRRHAGKLGRWPGEQGWGTGLPAELPAREGSERAVGEHKLQHTQRGNHGSCPEPCAGRGTGCGGGWRVRAGSAAVPQRCEERGQPGNQRWPRPAGSGETSALPRR